MKISNFKKHIDSVILARGKEYYYNGLVEDLEENELYDGLWTSFIEGTASYEIEIKLENTNIQSWFCDCPFDHGTICKHVVATLLAIEDFHRNPVSISTPEPKQINKKLSSIDEIFSKVSKQELQDFITNSLIGYGHGIESALVAHFSQYISGDFRKKYQKIVKNIFSNVNDLYDPYNRYSDSSFTLSDSLYSLIDSANFLIEENQFKEASVICQCLIEEFVNHIADLNDNDGYILNDVFETFQSLFTKVGETLKNELFQYCLKEYPKSKYHDYDFNDNLLRCLQLLTTSIEQQDVFIEMLDAQINQSKNTESSYQYRSYLRIKYNFFLDNNYHEKANVFLLENIQLQDFREIAINQTIQAKQFKQAQTLCLDGIIIAKENSKLGSIRNLQDFLLQIAEQEKDKEEICKWAEVLYKSTYRNMEYYKKLKSAYPKKYWKEKCESIIDEIKSKSKFGGYSDAENIANIFIVEKYFDRLLKFLQLNATRIQFIDKYAKHLIKKYPDYIIDLYANGIKKHAEKTGRPIYHQVVSYMKTLSAIPESQFMIKELLQYFRSQYKNRPAMMEILKYKFSNLL